MISNAKNLKKKKKISGKELLEQKKVQGKGLFILNENITDIIKSIKSLED